MPLSLLYCSWYWNIWLVPTLTHFVPTLTHLDLHLYIPFTPFWFKTKVIILLLNIHMKILLFILLDISTMTMTNSTYLESIFKNKFRLFIMCYDGICVGSYYLTMILLFFCLYIYRHHIPSTFHAICSLIFFTLMSRCYLHQAILLYPNGECIPCYINV